MMHPFFAAVYLLSLPAANAMTFSTVYEWKELDYSWPTQVSRAKALQDGTFKPGNMHLRFMAVYKDRLFLSLFRDSGIPATLVSLPTSSANSAPPKLAPFPSWEMHMQESCNRVINAARGTEVDSDGRLWVVDNGSEHCRAKLWIFDLANGDKIHLVHQFPDAVVSAQTNKRDLRDIVLDQTPDGIFAYITDYLKGDIVAFSTNKNESWTWHTPWSNFSTLALSPKKDGTLLFLRMSGKNHLFSFPVAGLAANENAPNAAFKYSGKWTARSYRMLIDDANILYAAFREQNYISTWNISEPFSEHKLFQDPNLKSIWPFTFALDTAGTFWMTEHDETIPDKPKYKLLRAAVGAKSYLHSYPSTPEISSRADDVKVVPRYNSIVEDEPQCQVVVTALICSNVISSVLCGIVILWLALKIKKMRKSTEQIKQNAEEVFVLRDGLVEGEEENTNYVPFEKDKPTLPDENLYTEVSI